MMINWKDCNTNTIAWKVTRVGRNKPSVNNIVCVDTESSNLFSVDGNWRGWRPGVDEEKYKKAEKIGIMYIWMLSIDDTVYYGRYGSELSEFLKLLCKSAHGATITIFVHNLPWDFQFLANWVDYGKVFARSMHSVMRCESNKGQIVWRDSYLLSQASLADTAVAYRLDHRKAAGDVDYNTVYLPCTPLTDKRLSYCELDCLVLRDFIALKLAEYGSIQAIPLSMPAEVRKIIKDGVTAGADNKAAALRKWYFLTKKSSPDLTKFDMLTACFSGGYVHASALYAGRVLHNVHSYDEQSAYIAALLYEKYPFGGCFYPCSLGLDELNTTDYAYILQLRITDVKCRRYNPILSMSRCSKRDTIGAIDDNGRIVEAAQVVTTVTDIDYNLLCQYYTWGKIELMACYRCRKTWLPKPLALTIARLYKDKKDSKLYFKSLPDDSPLKKESGLKLQVCKDRVCCTYGVTVTKYVSDDIIYSAGEWGKQKADDARRAEQLGKHENAPLLPYQVGVWVTAYARRNLFAVAEKVDDVLCYSDTDCVNICIDRPEVIEDYNSNVAVKRAASCQYYGIDPEDLAGLGEFEKKPTYAKFKAINAKQYAAEEIDENGDSKFIIAVSGVNKKSGAEWLKKVENLKPSTKFPAEVSGRKYRYYLDSQPDVTITDYLGNAETIKQKKGAVLLPVSFKLNDITEYNKTGSEDCENAPDFWEKWVANPDNV